MQLAARGVETCEITLHVGLGTFQPVRVKQIEDHHMEAERYEISEAAAAAINRALDERRRVIAVGTTSVRTLESVAREHGGRIGPARGETTPVHYPRIPLPRRAADCSPTFIFPNRRFSCWCPPLRKRILSCTLIAMRWKRATASTATEIAC